MQTSKMKFDPQMLLMSEPWAKAYIMLHSHPKRSLTQMQRLYRWFHLVLPQGLLRRYLLG